MIKDYYNNLMRLFELSQLIESLAPKYITDGSNEQLLALTLEYENLSFLSAQQLKTIEQSEISELAEQNLTDYYLS